MSYYSINYGTYKLVHSTNEKIKYLNYFEFGGKKYPIGSLVKLNDNGMRDMFYNNKYNYIKDEFRLIDHYISEHGNDMYKYIIGHTYGSRMQVIHLTSVKPDDLISEVLRSEMNERIEAPGELQVNIPVEENEPNYFPKDWEVPGLMFGWVVAVIVWIGAFVFKDWWITMLIQLATIAFFVSWREEKVNEAIITQKFNK
jgi:hypothetical protein